MLQIDRRILPGLRVKRSLGLPDSKKGRDTAERYDAMLSALVERGRTDLVRGWLALKGPRAKLYLHDLYSAFRVGGALPDATGVGTLREAVDAWLKDADISDVHRERTRELWNTLLADHKGATLADLPKIVRAEQERCALKGYARTFARVRSAAQALVRDTAELGRHSDLWKRISSIPLVKTASKAKRLPPTIEAYATAIAAIESEKVKQTLALLALTGMLPQQDLYKVARGREGNGLRIAGTKNERRDRVIPFLWNTNDVAGGSTVRRYLRDTESGIIPKDGRNVFSQALVRAEIPKARRGLYMGHKPKDMTEHYERAEFEADLAADAAKLRAVLKPIIEAAGITLDD